MDRLEQTTERADLVCLDAHEVRNPLAGIVGCALTLLGSGDELDEDGRRELIEVIARQAMLLDAMVRAAAGDPA